MDYEIIGNSIFGTRRITPDGRAYDNDFSNENPEAYTRYEKDQCVGALIYAMMEHYSAESECAIETAFWKNHCISNARASWIDCLPLHL